MPAVPWWAVVSSAAAPLLLVVGWTIAAVRQPDGYDPIGDTISLLSSYGPTDRAILTGCLAGLGAAHLVTSLGLRFAAPAGRLVLGLGGLATLLVAVFPKPDSTTPREHGVTAAVAFIALALWPAAATLYHPAEVGRRVGTMLRTRRRPRVPDAGDRRGRPIVGRPERDRPWPVRTPVGFTAAIVMLVLAGWLGLELSGGRWAGLAERLAAGAQALWPLVVVLSVWRAQRRPPAVRS